MILCLVFACYFLSLIYIAKASAFSVNTPAQIKDYLVYKAQAENLPVSLVLGIAECESRYDTFAVKNSDQEHSLGIFQINLKAHTNITEEQAFNTTWNIRWAVDEMVLGHWAMWKNCYDHVKKLSTVEEKVSRS